MTSVTVVMHLQPARNGGRSGAWILGGTARWKLTQRFVTMDDKRQSPCTAGGAVGAGMRSGGRTSGRNTASNPSNGKNAHI